MVVSAGGSAGVVGRVGETAGDGIPSAFADGSAASFGEGLERLSRVVLEAAAGEGCWLERIRVGLVALLGFLEDEPAWARQVLVEWPADEVAQAACTLRVGRALRDVLEAGHGEVIVGAELTPSTALIAELVVTGVVSLVRSHLLRGEKRRLVSLAPQLMSAVVVPYLGRGAAKADREQEPAGVGDTWVRAEVVPVRPQPQTLVTLGLLASAPSLGNREIATATGLDSKQVSKILKTLEQRCLVENAWVGPATRGSNAWVLTPYGHRILELITRSFAAARRVERATPARRARRRAAAQFEAQEARSVRSVA